MSIYKQLGLKTIINAADSYTMLGGSLIPAEVWKAMEEASQSFVLIDELHNKVGEKLAELTRNEAAMVTSGAAAGLSVSVAACITGTDPQHIDKFPELAGLKKEVLIHRCQRNGFNLAIQQIGAVIVEFGDASAALPEQLQAAINAQTSCIVYYASQLLSEGALSLEEVIAIAAPLGIPVIVDAAAQLPPVDNLWLYTQMGASMAIFSGGKTLRGPQSSGLIVGQKKLIEACRMNVGPNMNIGRAMKVGKEEMIGLLVAVERYLSLDHVKLKEQHEAFVHTLRTELEAYGYLTRRLYPAPNGQDYPQAAVRAQHISAEKLKERLEHSNPSIFVALSQDKEEILINPLHLVLPDIDLILQQMRILTDNPAT